MKRLARDEKRARDVQQILLQNNGVAIAEIRVGQVDLENTIVVRQGRSEQERRDAIDEKFETGKVARIVVKQTVGASSRYAHVAMAIEHEESVILLHRASPACRRRCHRNVELRLRLGLEHVHQYPEAYSAACSLAGTSSAARLIALPATGWRGCSARNGSPSD